MGLMLLALQVSCTRAGFTAPSDAGRDANADAGRDANADAGRDANADASRDARDGGLVDHEVGADGAPSIQVSNLAAEWSTSKSIAWGWSTTGSDAAFSAFKLVVGETQADVVSRSGSAVVIGGAQNPELGHFRSPDEGSPVARTITCGHKPATAYYGQIIAVDTLGRESASNIVPAKTISTSSTIVVFSEQTTAGYSIPSSFTHSQDGPYQGTYCYIYSSSCPTGKTKCWAQLHRQNFYLDLNKISQAAFKTTAFFEVAVSCDIRHSYYSQVRVAIGKSVASFVAWRHEGFTINCNGVYQLIQVPLRFFQIGKGSLPFADLAQGMVEFTVGGNWGDGATIRVDEVRIRW